VNFSIFSASADLVELLLFDNEDVPQPSHVIRLDPVQNRTYHYWHTFVPGLAAGQICACRVHGPSAPSAGLRSDPEKVLLDPYGRSVVVPAHYSRDAAGRPGSNTAIAMKNVVVDLSSFDWEGAVRGLQLAHTTIMRWVQRYVPEFEKRWVRYMRRSGRSWRVDETYLKVRGRWVYLFRGVDRDGNPVDFRLSPKRDVAAAKAFFRKALRTQGRAPVSITLDGYAASHRAVR